MELEQNSMTNLIITGGLGFIGTAFLNKYRDQFDRVVGGREFTTFGVELLYLITCCLKCIEIQ